MKKRIFISVFLLSMLIVIASFAISVFSTYHSLIEEQDRMIGATIDKLGSVDYNREKIMELFEVLPDKHFRTSYIDNNGNVIFDSKINAKDMSSHISRIEILDALKTGRGSAVRMSDTFGEEYRYQAKRLDNGDVLRLSYSTKTVFGIMRDSLLKLLLFSLAIFVVCAFAASIISNIIVRPINNAYDNPEEFISGYEELIPLQQRIAMQKNELLRRANESESNTKKFRQILNSIREGLVILDKDMNIVSINNSARKIFGYTGNKHEHIFNACREEGFREFVKAFAENKEEKYIYKLEGSVYSMRVSTMKTDDEFEAYVLMIQNITNDFYSEKLRREFTSNVSHELKTPLTTISGLTELIVSGMAKKDDIPKFASKISAESKRLVRLIDDIIRLTRIDEGQNFQMEPLPLADLVDEQVARYKEIAPDMNIIIDSEPTTVMGERQLISEMISNLIDNAVKYNKPGTNIKVKVKNKKNGVLLSVEDDGIGIEPKHHARIFERFYRVDKSHSRNTGGTGLGLSIVKNAAVLHNAKLDIESDISKGCKIKIKFPFM